MSSIAATATVGVSHHCVLLHDSHRTWLYVHIALDIHVDFEATPLPNCLSFWAHYTYFVCEEFGTLPLSHTSLFHALLELLTPLPHHITTPTSFPLTDQHLMM